MKLSNRGSLKLVLIFVLLAATQSQRFTVDLRALSPPTEPPLFQMAAGQERQFVGVAHCASTTCHGSVTPKPGDQIQQNEYRVWANQDKHAGAYDVLLQSESKEIAGKLNIQNPETSDRCLVCHSVSVAESQQARSFDLSDGVSCEVCHGAAGSWLSEHFQRNWTPEQSARLGMYDSKDLQFRTQLCLRCHLGSQQGIVNHQLIAAGHPDLVFELDKFSALMPGHWRVEQGNWEGVQRWAMGQVVAFRESMRLLSWKVTNNTSASWPDFAEFECVACHHNLTPSSPRQERGYEGRAGIPPWNPSRYIVLRYLTSQLGEAARSNLEELVTKLKRLLQKGLSVRAEVAGTADEIAQLMEQQGSDVAGLAWNEERVLRLIESIARDASIIANSGIRSAEQVTMAVDALFISYQASTGKTNEQLDSLIDRLYNSLQGPYESAQFAAQLRRIRDLIRQMLVST